MSEEHSGNALDAEHAAKWRELQQQKSNNYIMRTWRGELPLPRAYWINFVVGSIPFRLLDKASDGFWEKFPQELIWPLIACYAAFYTWAIVGVWQSAQHRTPNGPDAWGWIARVITAIAAVVLVISFAKGLLEAPAV